VAESAGTTASESRIALIVPYQPPGFTATVVAIASAMSSASRWVRTGGPPVFFGGLCEQPVTANSRQTAARAERNRYRWIIETSGVGERREGRKRLGQRREHGQGRARL